MGELPSGLALCWQKEEKRVTAQVSHELLGCQAHSENEARELTSETTGREPATNFKKQLYQAPRQVFYQQGAPADLTATCACMLQGVLSFPSS